jgi:hypothetical protein
MRSELESLRQSRRRGQSPALPVIVTDEFLTRQSMADVGCVVVSVHRDEPRDWSPLAGLDVILIFRKPAERRELARAIREARPRRLRAHIDGQLGVMFP